MVAQMVARLAVYSVDWKVVYSAVRKGRRMAGWKADQKVERWDVSSVECWVVGLVDKLVAHSAVCSVDKMVAKKAERMAGWKDEQ